ncbi:hypothetical protein [Bradyrhizobium cosmicum]|uniref:hypothetical protein n=1 Tax=Bradyrhizobium cosmicum TaxID=1404864 RepID=UPI0028E89AA7|nr:hypothetical protein [Bradyrhizobium cosmicum]
MPARLKRNKRGHRAHIMLKAIQLFRQGMHAPNDHATRIALAAALGRSKFRANPLDREP